MLTLDLDQAQADFQAPELKEKLAAISQKEEPDFSKYCIKMKILDPVLKEIKKFDHVIVAGRGGSITSFEALWKALGSEKKVFLVKSVDPDLIAGIKKKCSPKNSVFICVSKSGTNIEVIENLMAFKEFPTIIVTERKDNPLRQIADLKHITFIEHPPVGGRFSAGTASCILPAKACDLPAEEFIEGLADMHKKCAPDKPLEKNMALLAAAALWQSEAKGLTEVYLPIYSSFLSGFSELITQLMHESVCKQGQGQTFLAVEAPQAQHHSNQRFFGGRQNMVGFYLRVEESQAKNLGSVIPRDLKDIVVKDSKLKMIDGLPLNKSLAFEFQGNLEAAKKAGIPCLVLSLKKITPYALGELMAFFQYLAVYSAWLREVKAFDQPAVEESKRISFELRKQFHGPPAASEN